jgi:hypothetical protein
MGMQVGIRNGGAHVLMNEEIAKETWEDVKSISVDSPAYGVCASGSVFLSDIRVGF